MITILQLLLLTSIPSLIQSFGSTIHRLSRSSTASTRIFAKSYPFEGKPSLFSSKSKRSRNFQFSRRSLHSSKNLDGNSLQPVFSLNGLLCILVTLWYAASSIVTSQSSTAITSMNKWLSKINILTKGLIPRVEDDYNRQFMKKRSDSLSIRISNMFEFLKQASDASDLDMKASTYPSLNSVKGIEYDERNDAIVFSNDEGHSSIETVESKNVDLVVFTSEITIEAPIAKKNAIKVSIPVSQALVNATLEIQGKC
jgi:hypothetical protein